MQDTKYRAITLTHSWSMNCNSSSGAAQEFASSIISLLEIHRE